jgi:hypothetical protein
MRKKNQERGGILVSQLIMAIIDHPVVLYLKYVLTILIFQCSKEISLTLSIIINQSWPFIDIKMKGSDLE